eukprot:TRINITY_DN24882_c0_g1_i1.p1 TRINITY_DN24882_c0_g1~~TRINITY_DN24882_c0_g1_i1.p1  ORF type:complete len:482 (+),score=114.58 TRINITY_DN24882_c0_g1_i1:106-1551(+)
MVFSLIDRYLPQYEMPAPSKMGDYAKFIFTFLAVAEMARCVYSVTFYEECDFLCYKDFGMRLLTEGDLDYGNYVCPQGPMYYPVMFVYFYAAFMFVTGGSVMWSVVVNAMCQFACTLLSFVVFAPYMKKGKWAFIVLAIITQSVYMTSISRATNDVFQSFAILLMMWAVQHRRWWLSSFLYAFAVSYKMNALLIGPALLLCYVLFLPAKQIFIHFLSMGLFQVLAPLPFLIHNPINYLRIAFNFSRDFNTHTNLAWGFLEDSVRYNPLFYKFLLVLTLAFNIILVIVVLRAAKKVLLPAKPLTNLGTSANYDPEQNRVAMTVVLGIFVLGNFIGYTFSRGIHIQFILWIFFTLVFLFVELAQINALIALVMLAVMDFAHQYVPNVYDFNRITEFWTIFQTEGWSGKAAHILHLFAYHLPPLSDEEKDSYDGEVFERFGQSWKAGFSMSVIPVSLLLIIIEVTALVLALFFLSRLPKFTKKE